MRSKDGKQNREQNSKTERWRGELADSVSLCWLALTRLIYIAQETFVTSSSTLLSGGESFFSSLLSGRHKSEQDENGAFFIDRKRNSRCLITSCTSLGSPKYFSPILQYLRSSVLDIPDGYKLSLMRTEAEFYGIQKIIDHIDFLEAEKKDLDSKKRGLYIVARGEKNTRFSCSLNTLFLEI